jgi:hypothetical protein
VVWVERSRYGVTVLHAESFEDLVNVGLLGESDSIVCKVDLDSEEPVNFAEILDVKFRLEGGNKVFSGVVGGSKDRDVVHIDGKKEVAGAVDFESEEVSFVCSQQELPLFDVDSTFWGKDEVFPRLLP